MSPGGTENLYSVLSVTMQCIISYSLSFNICNAIVLKVKPEQQLRQECVLCISPPLTVAVFAVQSL